MLKTIRYVLLLSALSVPAYSQAGILDVFSSEKKPEQSATPIPADIKETPDTKKPVEKKDAKVKKEEEMTTEVLPEKLTDEKSADAKPLDASDFVGPRPKGYRETVPAIIKDNEDIEQLACKITPTVGPDERNMNPIKKSNNLMRKAGSPSRAAGSYIQITGMVLDENCLPIQGAVVEIWQADSLGNYEWEYDKSSHFSLPLEGKDKNFLYSGMAQTDNRGQFYLLTMLPGSKGDRAPHINIVVKRGGYDTLNTRMYFAEHPKNDTDKLISSASEPVRERLIAVGRKLDPTGQTEGRLYYFPITMKGVGAYKRF